MPEIHRHVFLLHQVDGMAQGDVATALGIPKEPSNATSPRRWLIVSKESTRKFLLRVAVLPD
ncbi:MAG: hypothetical protein IPJ12_01825 [Betaproteobacteria bacterium]|nr:hypothetical protein [Betaproteobacteria bacterium]